MVVKRSGERQPFDRRKILLSLEIACRKRPVSPESMENAVRAIERWAATCGERGVDSSAIGEQIMHHLHALDPVAYVRFVSVYQSFETIEEFEELLHEMEKAEATDPEGQRTLFGGLEAVERPLPGLRGARRREEGEGEGD